MFGAIGSRSALGFRVHLFELLLDEVLLVVDLSLPVVIIFVDVLVVLLGLDHIEVDLIIVLVLIPVHDANDVIHFSHQLELVLERVRGLL